VPIQVPPGLDISDLPIPREVGLSPIAKRERKFNGTFSCRGRIRSPAAGAYVGLPRTWQRANVHENGRRAGTGAL